MLEFEKLMAKKNTSVTDSFGENIVRGGDFDGHGLKSSKKWGIMAETADGAWVAETGRIEIQKSTGHNGTPAKKIKSTVLDLDSAVGRKGLGATDSNSVVSQQIEEITGPGTYRLSLDYRGTKKGKASIEDTGTAEVWIGDKLVSVLVQEKRGWEERIVEFTLEEGDIPADGVVDLKLVSTGRADGRGAQVDNISLREIGETGLLGDELVTNGDFEDSGGKGVYEAIPGWTVNAESVIELKSVRKPATPRDKNDTYVELDSHGKDSNSVVVQEIDVPEDGTYLLSFDYSPRAGRGKDAESTSPIKVMVGDEVVAEISADQVGWEPYTFNVDLAKGPVKLSFEGAGEQDTIGGLLDKVALRKVGELAEDAEPINAPEPVVEDPAESTEEASTGHYKSGLLGEVHFADEVLKKLDQALEHADDTPDATFVATEIDYGNDTGWFHTPLDMVLEHDAESIEIHTEGAGEQNFNHSVIELSGEIYLEAGSHEFFNRTDDGFRLTIDGQEIAEFEGLRAAKTTKGVIEIAEDGWYSIDVDYFEWMGHSKLRIEHSVDGGPREVLDEDRLRHEVEPDNQGPDATDDAAQGLEDEAITIDALGNDTDPDGDTVFIVDATDGANGTVTFTPPNVEEVASGEVTLGENLIVNGDFENNPLNGRIGWGHYDSIEGWDSPVGRVEVQTRDYNTGNTRGNAVVELDSHGKNSNATLLQEVEISEAGTYQFDMDYAMRGCNGWTNGVGVRINGETVHEVIKPKEKGFQTLTLDVDLDPGTATIEIYALGKQDTIGTVIDNISLRQVQPGEPVRVISAPDGGVITYTPEPGFVGEDTFTYTISDGNGGTDTATVTVVVDGSNTAPVAADDQAETNEDTAIVLNLLDNDQDPDGDALTITDLGSVENGTLTLNEDGTVTFTPDADFHGTVSFDYTVSDGEFSSTATATVVVASVNDAVVAEDDAAQTDEDAAVTFDLLANDSDADGDALTITDLGPVENGTLTLNEDGTVTFTPDADFHGTVSFEYTVSDGETTATATATVQVAPVNDAVVAEDDAFSTPEDAAIVMDLLANDSDVDGDELTITELGEVENGTLTLNEDGTVTFTPDADFHGTVEFEYTVSDGTVSTTATATVQVTPVNDSVEANNDLFRTDEDTSLVVDLLANDQDPDGDALSVVSVDAVPNGTLTENADGTFTFTPDANFHGTVSFDYTVSDGETTSTATATITVDPVNDGPVAVADLAETEAGETVIIDVLANDSDADGDALSVVNAFSAADGTVEVLEDGRISFTADQGFFGETSFSYTVTDGAETDTVEVTVLVAQPNRAPEPADDVVIMDEDTTITLDLLANDSDPDGDVLSLVSFGTSANGVLVQNEDGTVTFTPNADFHGDVTISYTVADEDGLTASARLRVTVENTNDGPVAEDDVAEVSREATISVDVLLNDSDIDPDDVIELVSATSTRGTVSIVDGQVFFDPGSDFDDLAVDTSSDEVITYTIRDSAGATTTGTLTVTVTAPRQDSIIETLAFSDRGAAGSTSNLDAEAGLLDISSVGLEGADNDDRLKIDLDARGGIGRTSSRGDSGDDSDTGNGQNATDALDAGGLGGDATAELSDAFLTGNVFEDRLDVIVDAFGGRGGKGGNGGLGGDANPLGIHRDVDFGGNETVTDYGEGTAFLGGNGGNGADGSDGGNAIASILGGVFDGGADDDRISVEIEAAGGDGGNGGNGGEAGDGGNDQPFGGDHTNTSTSGNAGNGGRGGDAFAEAADASLLGGAGDDTIDLIVVAEAGEGGIGGRGGHASAGLYVDTKRTDNGLFLDATFEGEQFSLRGHAGDGGDAGDNGSVEVLVSGNLMDGGDGNDTILLEVEAVGHDIALGGSAGDHGVTATLTPEETGDYTVHETAGVAGSDGASGAAGSVTVDVLDNQILGGAGDDVIEIVLSLTGAGDINLTFDGNTVDGGSGFDVVDFSAVDASVTIDLASGLLAVGDGISSNAIAGIEHVIATDFDDVLAGSGAAETLTGGTGDDVLSGGGGLDVFVFANGNGADEIMDFSNDVIDLSAHSGALDFAGLSISDTAEGALITLGATDTILLHDVAGNTLTEDHFQF